MLVVFIFNFVIKIITPNYFICNNIADYKILNIQINYPISCDQESYYSAIRNIDTLFIEGYVYQGRPLFILIHNFLSKLIDAVTLFKIQDFDNVIHISIIVLNTVCIFVTIMLIIKVLNLESYINNINFISISLILTASPLFKWGVFDPSNQLWTAVIIMFFTNLLINNSINLSYRNSLIIGILVLIHRTFIIGYIMFFLLLLVEKKIEFSIKNLISIFKIMAVSLVPFIVYNLFIFLIEGQLAYDENSSYYGQFIWLPLLIFTTKRYEGGWHCMDIPDFVSCYLVDNTQLIIYMLLPIIFLLISHPLNLFKKDLIINQLVKFTFFMYLFYMFIGWYPPIRFSYYSIGNLFVIMNIYLLLKEKNNILKFLHTFSLLTYFIYLNHWNFEGIVDLNSGIYISYIILFIYGLVKLKFSRENNVER